MAQTAQKSTGAGAQGPRRRSLNALGGVAAQGTQALTGLTLQILAARLLGVEGLGLFAVIFAFVVMATAVTSGFVGDSLTVLDRMKGPIRTALQSAWIILPVLLGMLVTLTTWATGFVGGYAAVAAGIATAAFVFEDVIRRLLMASLVFWRIVVVDLTVLVGSISWIALVYVRTGELTLTQLLIGLALGQVVGTASGIGLLPVTERRLATWRGADWKPVVRYGSWRALQQVVRPTMLAGVRVACVALASLAAAGELEAARIYMAPAMIVVTGMSSVLFASYAADRTVPIAQQLRRVDRNVIALVTVISVLCGAAIVVKPWLGPLITDGAYDLPGLTVLGWSVFAAATALSTPYGQLAGVRGRHVGVLLIRAVDSAVALTAVIVLLALGAGVAVVPFVLSVTTTGGGMAMRRLAARSATRTD